MEAQGMLSLGVFLRETEMGSWMQAPRPDEAQKLWTDRLHEKHECFATAHTEVRDSLIGDEKVYYRLPSSLPVFQKVIGAVQGPLLFLCGSTDDDWDEHRSMGALLVGRRGDDNIYDVHVWHELYPGACEQLGIIPPVKVLRE